MKIDIMSAIHAGADPAKLGLQPITVIGADATPMTFYAKAGTVVHLTITHTRIIASWAGNAPVAGVSVTTNLPRAIHLAECRYAKYGLASIEEVDGDLNDGLIKESVDEAQRLTKRANRITQHMKTIEKIRHPRGVSPITIHAKQKRKRIRRDAEAIAAFLRRTWDALTPPHGQIVDQMLKAAGLTYTDLYVAWH